MNKNLIGKIIINVTPPRVWIVEDDNNERFMLERALKETKNWVHVRFFEDGEDAKAALEGATTENVPHLIISDLKMPGLDGLGLLKWLRESDRPFLPLLILTNSDKEADVRRSLGEGANAYHVKTRNPLEMKSNLITILDYWLRQAKLPQVSE